MQPKVSIVIPVYNGTNYMREAIDSALNQTYENCEVIVVNDGSTDETEQIALSYGDRIRYFAKENGGVSSALNIGIENMEGEYFSWLSHDDVYYPRKIEIQIEALQKSGQVNSIIYSNWNQLQMPEHIEKAVPRNYQYGERDYRYELRPVLFGLINGCTTLIHRSHFERAGLFDERLMTAQDYDMWFRIFRNQEVIYIEEPLIMYRIHGQQGSVTITDFQKNCEEIQWKMIQNVTEEEVKRVFGGYYRFYFDMLRMADLNHWEGLRDRMLAVFERIEEPEYRQLSQSKFVLYCAGRNGKRLQEEFCFRGIEIDRFSDGNQELWGNCINGIPVVPLNEIDKDAYIIVTKDDPEEVALALHEKGYKNIKTYDEISERLYSLEPVREKVISYYRKDVGTL